ncbi:MAG: YdcF family protein [Clostridium sp.]|nr:YdcF family protein [Clostridium sp.]
MTSLAFIWRFFASLSLFLVYGKWYYRRNADRIPRWVPVSVVTTCIAGLTVLAAVCIMVFSGVAGSDPKGMDYVIVLGAQGKERTVNGSLKLRLDKAIEYVEENPDTILVLSGGPVQGQKTSEAELMYEYLRYNGVRPEQMLLEKRSASTVENVAFSRIVIEQDRLARKRKREALYQPVGPGAEALDADKPLEIGVLTSNFHVFRARLTARKWGIENVSGIAAGSDPVLFVHLCVRECASILKDRLVGNM